MCPGATSLSFDAAVEVAPHWTASAGFSGDFGSTDTTDTLSRAIADSPHLTGLRRLAEVIELQAEHLAVLREDRGPPLAGAQHHGQTPAPRGRHEDDVTRSQSFQGASDRVLYRHLFARYVEPGTPLARAFLDPVRHAMWNRVDGWLETKALVAEMSLRADLESLTAQERDAVRSLVPWTRLLDDVSDAELGTGAGYILKRSHDYGGKSVVIGREAGPAGFRAAVAAARRDPPGSWVAQELIDSPAIDRFFALHAPGEPVRAARGPLHVDISTYASLVEGVPSGGNVCRAASGRVVNIVGGGGVAPLYPEDVLQEALDAR